MPTLKSCPFCGGSADFIEVRAGGIGRLAIEIRCLTCGNGTKTHYANLDYSAKEVAIEAWNRRVKPCASRCAGTNAETFKEDE